MRRIAPALVAAGVLMSGASSVQGQSGPWLVLDSTQAESPTVTSIGLTLNGGQFPGMSYRRSGGPAQLTLVARPGQPVQCFSPLVASQQPAGKRAVLDQNGLLEPIQITSEMLETFGGQAPVRSDVNAVAQNWLYAGEIAAFSTLQDPWVDPAAPPTGRSVHVDEVEGYCVVLPIADTTSSELTPECASNWDSDALFSHTFDPAAAQGELKMSVAMQPGCGGQCVSYTYTMWAEGGPVYDVSLREQFPYYRGLMGTSLYSGALNLEHFWNCQAFGDAHCSREAAEVASGAGYARVDSRVLPETGRPGKPDACLVVTVNDRAIRATGPVTHPYVSNKLYTSALYSSWELEGNDLVLKKDTVRHRTSFGQAP